MPTWAGAFGAASQMTTPAVVATAPTMATTLGGIVGLVAKAQDTSAASEPGSARHSDSVSAANLGNAATAVAVVGGVATAAGAVIWLTAATGPQVGTNGREILLERVHRGRQAMLGQYGSGVSGRGMGFVFFV